MQIVISGRLSQMVKLEKNFQTLIQTPAPDAYSQPSTYKVSSDQQLGHPGDEVKLTIELRSWVRTKSYVEKGTGIQKSFWDPNVVFQVIKCEPLKATSGSPTQPVSRVS